MKTALKSEKGFSLILIIILVVVAVFIVLVLGSMFAMNSSKSSSTSTTSTKTQDAQSLEKIEDQAYTFFYPKGYTRGSGDTDVTLLYQNPKNPAISMVALKVLTSKTKLGNPTFEICKKAGELERDREDDEITAEVDNSHPIAEPIKTNGLGCKITIKSKLVTSNVRDTIVSIERDLWRDENSTTGYVAVAQYYESALQSEKDEVTSAVEEFALK